MTEQLGNESALLPV